ncbi:MAG: hypothetical protein ACLFSL_03305 [Candidatus Woesearchaeota archaeon]
METDVNISERVKNSAHEFALAGKGLIESVPETILEDKKTRPVLEKLKKEHEKMNTNLFFIAKVMEGEDKKNRSRRYIRREHRRFKRLSGHIEKFDKLISEKDGPDDVVQNLARLRDINSYIDRLLTNSLLEDDDTGYIEEVKKLEPL